MFYLDSESPGSSDNKVVSYSSGVEVERNPDRQGQSAVSAVGLSDDKRALWLAAQNLEGQIPATKLVQECPEKELPKSISSPWHSRLKPGCRLQLRLVKDVFLVVDTLVIVVVHRDCVAQRHLVGATGVERGRGRARAVGATGLPGAEPAGVTSRRPGTIDVAGTLRVGTDITVLVGSGGHDLELVNAPVFRSPIERSKAT